MAKVKTYWDEIKDQEVFYYGGNRGWEVHFRFIETREWDRKTGDCKVKKSLQPQWPWGYQDKVERSEKSLCRNEVMRQHKQRKMLAQASRNQDEYRDLHSRINKERWEDIVATELKGINLGNYIRSKYLTEREGYALFYNM